MRLSPTNFVYNHIGHFAAAGHAVAKAIFLGGVTRRFPQLKFAFLEGGASWGAQLFGDLIEHWERRNAKALERMDPAKLDRKLLMDLVVEHGYDDMAEALRKRGGYPNPEAHLTAASLRFYTVAHCTPHCPRPSGSLWSRRRVSSHAELGVLYAMLTPRISTLFMACNIALRSETWRTFHIARHDNTP